METKTYDYRRQAKWRILFGVIFLLIGIILQILDYKYLVLGSLQFGSWLTMVGIVLIAIGVTHQIRKKVLKIDERYQQVVYKATGITFMAIIYACLAIFVVAMIKPVQVDLAMGVSYLLFFEIIVYRVALWHYNKRI